MKRKSIFTALIASAAVLGSAQAAIVTWTSTADATDADIITTGTLLEAANFGGPEVVANGVTFKAVSFPGDPYPLTNLSNINYNANGSSTYSATGGDIDTILTTFSSVSTLSDPLELTGLTIDTQYVVQVFFNFNNAGRTLTVTSPDAGSTSVVLAGNVGGIFTGTFTADATTQAMSWTENTGSNVTNGYQLRAIPEPSSVALLGLGGLALLGRRRR